MKVKNMLEREIRTLPEDVNKRTDAENIQMSIQFKDGHIHHVMPTDEIAKVLTEDAASHITLPLSIASPAVLNPDTVQTSKVPEQVVFHNRQAIGDILTMTCAIRDFKAAFPKTKLGVITTASHLWDNNPYIDHTFRDEQHVVKIGPGFLTNKSNYWNLHMCNAFRMDIEQKLGITYPQGPIRPDIWMTQDEMKRPPLIPGAYWLFVYGGEPGWTAKQYHRWQEVVDILKDKVQFVQIGAKHHPYPPLNNVINYIGKTEDRHTGIRDLFNLFYHCQGSMGLVSMHMHLSAAFNNPCVVLAAAREPAWFTQYFGHQYIQTNGTMACAEKTACWKCDVKACKNLVPGQLLPKCVEIIEPEELAEGVLKYYKGGRLEFGKKIPNTFFKNIAKESKTFAAVPAQLPLPSSEQDVVTKSGLTFGGGSLTDKDWAFIKRTIENNNCKDILEFGAGLSSLLIESLPTVEKMLTYEMHDGWIKKIGNLSSGKTKIITWDGKDVILPEGYEVDHRFDFIFVDGPSGGAQREWSTKYAGEHADLVLVHDAGRDHEREWQKRHLMENYQLISKGGHRCHLWKLKSKLTDKDENVPFRSTPACSVKNPPAELEECPPCQQQASESNPLEVINEKRIARMITTCRGYGGSERSSINIMAMLQDKGYNVILTPTGTISGEYGRNIPKGVQVARWDSIPAFKTDITVLYCSDTIWNYNNEQYSTMMPKLNSLRKVMVVNFKVGAVGQTAWTKGWDKYLFLNNEHRLELLQRMPDCITKAMAPPTDLSLYYENEPNYDMPLTLMRHNSQGDAKFRPENNNMILNILELAPDTQFHFMPAKSDCIDHPNVHKHQKNVPAVHDFLKLGNCFWYPLPVGYTDGGPKVVMEAQASGLACIVDNHSGPKDRVTTETGWLCNNWNDYLEAIKEILANPELLKIKGQAAREWAKKEYGMENWIKEILGE